jgi:diacylglycerol kinase
MQQKRKPGFIRSFQHALRGCVMLFGTERNAKIHLACFIVVVATGLYFRIDRTEWMIILLASGAVIAAEAMNTAIEGTIDIVHPQHGEKAGRIKDIAAGAVLIVTCAAIAAGIIVFYPKVKSLF